MIMDDKHSNSYAGIVSTHFNMQEYLILALLPPLLFC